MKYSCSVQLDWTYLIAHIRNNAYGNNAGENIKGPS